MSGGIKVSNRDNPIVFFDISVGGKEIGRLKIEVFKSFPICEPGQLLYSYSETFAQRQPRTFVNFARASIKKMASRWATRGHCFIG